MNQTKETGYMKGFIPFAIAAAVLSLCGGFTASVPSNVVSAWGVAAINTTWITLAYSLGAAALAPIMGKLGDVIGYRATILLGTGLFGIGELLIALCPAGNMVWMLGSRFIVGVGAAAISPVIMAYIMTRFPAEKMGTGFSIYMLVSQVMVIFGPTVGGLVLAGTGNWRVVMYICVAACLLAFAACFVLVKKVDCAQKTMKGFDWFGALFSLIFFAMVLCIPTFGQSNGWLSSNTLICAGTAIVALIILVLIEQKQSNPILNGRFMARKQFILPVIVLFLTQGLLQACMTNTIMFCIYTTGSSTLSGIATSLMYFGMALGTIFIGPQADKREPRIVTALALIFVVAGAAAQLLFSSQTSLLLMCASLFLIGVGLGGNTTILMKVALSGCSPELAGSGSGTYNVFRDMAAPFGVAIFVPMFSGSIDTATLYSAEATETQVSEAIRGIVSAMHSTAVVEVICVIVGIVVCLMLPKVYTRKD